MADEKTVTISRSTYKTLVVALVVVALAASFFGGYTLGNVKTTGQVVAQGDQQGSDQNNGNNQEQQKIAVTVGENPVLGNAGAKVTVIEFSDFQCPYCERAYQQIDKQLKTEYVDTGKVKFAYRNFPLSSIHSLAQKAAEAAECASDQDKFWEYHDKLFDSQSSWSSTDGITAFKQYAADMGLDTAKFNQCLDSGSKAAEVNKDFQDGVAAGVSGTPTFYINGQQIVGAQPYTVIKQAIDSQLAA